MLPPLIDIAPFCAAIEKNQLILTANQRLAVHIQQAWGQHIAEQKLAWYKPRVLSIEHWLSHCWHQLQDQNHPLVEGLAEMGPYQSLYLWERAIEQCDRGLHRGFATMARDCLDLLQRWNLTIEDIPGDTLALSQFRRWTAVYSQLLVANQLVSTATTWQLVAEGFARSALSGESVIALYGFQSIPPRQSHVIAAASAEVVAIEAAYCNSDSVKLACSDPTEELQCAAKWAAQALLKNPQQRIGILIPQLNSNVQRTARILSEALAVHNCPRAVNISAGVPLSETPVVHAALNLLETVRYRRPLEYWIQLLYNPYCLFDQLPIQFSVNCEVALRDSGRFELSFYQFLQAVRQSQARLKDPAAVETLLQPLFALQDCDKQNSHRPRSFSDWALYFDQLVSQLGWPGTRHLDSMGYQQCQDWHRLLEKFCQLDNLDVELDRASAHNCLQRLVSEQIFHPQTGDAPLQILGMLEGAGMRFDQLWVVGMHSGNLPSSAAMNPILPADFQREQNMPHSLPERELQIAQRLLRSYQCNSRQLILSFPISDAEEELQASPLLEDLPTAEINELISNPHDLPDWLLQQNHCQLFKDKGSVFRPDIEKIRGGSSLLKNQSTCPLNAFVTHRLWARPLNQPVLGLCAMDRGNILHQVMYRLWGVWKSSARLPLLSEKQLREQLTCTVDEVLNEQAKYSPVLLGLRFRQLEQQRLIKLIGQWLEQEKQRPAFDVVAREQSQRIQFADLGISLFIDRVDRIDGDLVIIDYKTGEVSANDWSGDRPRDPQLPLYALASQSAVSGCAFAQIKGGKIKFAGLSNKLLIEGVKSCDNWPEQLQQWREAVTNLADEFLAGQARLEVYNNKEFAYQADLLPLNRWYEQSTIQTAVAGDASDYEH